ncbi:MAG: membrane dipeptidase [Dokdonella sp.]
MTSRRNFVGTVALSTFAMSVGWVAVARESAPVRWAGYANAFAIDGASGAEVLETKEDDPEYAGMLQALRDCGITGVIATIPPAGGSRYADKQFADAKQRIADWTSGIARHPDLLVLVRGRADLERAKRERRVGVIYAFQGAEPIADEIDRVAIFREAGVRVIQLTHNKRNLVGDGCQEPGNAGLSKFGHQLVERLNAERMVVDLAHGSQRTMREGILASKQPVLISHSGCRALADTTRLTSDAELKLLANRGGVVGIIYWPYLRVHGQQTSADVVRHIEHAINVCGEDHVGIGTDQRITPEPTAPEALKANAAMIKAFIADGVFAKGRDPDLTLYPTDLNVPNHLQALADKLATRGFSDARIEKVIGGNFARVMSEVWG